MPPLENPSLEGQEMRRDNPNKYARLRAEALAPYRTFRQFIYGAFGASGAIGGVVFFFKVIGAQDLATSVPNLALQSGVVALMVWLWRLEQRAKQKSVAQWAEREKTTQP